MRSGIAICLLLIFAASAAAENGKESVDIEALAWLEGVWKGPGEASNASGVATRSWTAPTEGVMSTTFQWHMPDTGHVHFAFTVIETTDDGVILRFIHRGTDFRPFEDAPLAYRLERADETSAFFRCLTNCRAHHKIERTGADNYVATWPKVDGDEPPLTIKYQRAAD